MVMARDQMTPFLRARSDDDLSACERLARVVHLADGYPVFVPDDDFRQFVAPSVALGAWVAEAGNQVVGHVALHPPTSLPTVRLVKSTLGSDASQLGVIARLFVAPTARRRGVARRLLEVAAAEAHRRGLVPIVDVVTRHAAAVALYEHGGWTRLGTVDLELPDGTPVEEFIYRAPIGLTPEAR